MKTTKKIMAICIAVIMVVCTMPVTAFATTKTSTVVWEDEDLQDVYIISTQSQTVEGVTISAPDGRTSYSKAFELIGYTKTDGKSFTFSTELGDFTKIEIVRNIDPSSYSSIFYGENWTKTEDGKNFIWSGDATNSVDIGCDITGISEIRFTIESDSPTRYKAGDTVNVNDLCVGDYCEAGVTIENDGNSFSVSVDNEEVGDYSGEDVYVTTDGVTVSEEGTSIGFVSDTTIASIEGLEIAKVTDLSDLDDLVNCNNKQSYALMYLNKNDFEKELAEGQEKNNYMWLVYKQFFDYESWKDSYGINEIQQSYSPTFDEYFYITNYGYSTLPTNVTDAINSGAFVYYVKQGEPVIETVKYLDENGEEQEEDAQLITTFDKNLKAGWYAVDGDITANELVIDGDVKIILKDSCELNVSTIYSANESGDALTIYGQSGDTGALTLSGACYSGTFTLNGGNVSGGLNLSSNGTVINGGSISGRSLASWKNIVVNGGSVEMLSSTNNNYSLHADDDVIISGGTLNLVSTGTFDMPGYGTQYSYGILADNVTITGGVVYAQGSEGGGYGIKLDANYEGTGKITLGCKSDSDSITISNFSDPVQIAEDQVLTDGINDYSGTISDTSVLDGKTLVGKAVPHNGSSLTLSDKIETTIYIDADAYGVDENEAVVKATYNHNSADTAPSVSTDTIALSDLPQYSGEAAKYVGAYMFTYACAPAQLTETCKIELYESSEASEPVFTETYSAKSYCDKVNAAYAAAENPDAALTKLNALCDSLVDYAKAAQFQFDYSKDLTDAYRNDEVQTLTAGDITATANVKTSDVAGFAFDCQDELNILVYTNSAVAPTGVSMNATKYADKINAAADSKDSTNFIRVKGLGSGNINKVVTVNTANGDITVSANAIVKAYLGSDAVSSNMKDLARAIYLYGAAAADYFGA